MELETQNKVHELRNLISIWSVLFILIMTFFGQNLIKFDEMWWIRWPWRSFPRFFPTNFNLHRVNQTPRCFFLNKNLYSKPPSFKPPQLGNPKPPPLTLSISQMQLDREALITARESLMAELKALKEATHRKTTGWFHKLGIFPPKMDGENIGNPYFLMDDLGKPIIFGNTQLGRWSCCFFW